MTIKTLIYGDDRAAMKAKAVELRATTRKVYLRSAKDWQGELEKAGAVIVIGTTAKADAIRAAYGALVRAPDLLEDTQDPGLSRTLAVRRNASLIVPVNIGVVDDRAGLAAAEGRPLRPLPTADGTAQEQLVETARKAGPATPDPIVVGTPPEGGDDGPQSFARVAGADEVVENDSTTETPVVETPVVETPKTPAAKTPATK